MTSSHPVTQAFIGPDGPKRPQSSKKSAFKHIDYGQLSGSGKRTAHAPNHTGGSRPGSRSSTPVLEGSTRVTRASTPTAMELPPAALVMDAPFAYRVTSDLAGEGTMPGSVSSMPPFETTNTIRDVIRNRNNASGK
jgi:hypothetical protein